jgi:hypothetical protein
MTHLEQDARTALLERYTSRIQGYKINLLAIVVGFFAYVELIRTLPMLYFGLFFLPLGVGVLACLGFWSAARMLWFGKHVRDIIRESYAAKNAGDVATGKENLLDRLDEQIYKRWRVEREDYKPNSFTGSIIKIGGCGKRLLRYAILIGFAVMLVALALWLLWL